MSKKLLREYIKQSLNEYGGFGDGMGGVYGVDFTGGQPKKLYSIFVEPFVNVFKTAAGQGKEISQKAQTVGKVVLTTVLSTLIPIYSERYDEIYANEKEKIEKIKQQYKEVYDRTYTAFHDNDILAAAFMYDPGSFLVSALAKKAPIPAAETANVLAGGGLDKFIEKLKKTLYRDKKTVIDGDTGPYAENLNKSGNLLKENIDITKILSKKKIQDLINSNPTVKRMKQDMQSIARETLETMFDDVQKINSANSLDDLKNTSSKISNVIQQLKDVPNEERKKIEDTMLQNLKKSILQFYIKNLKFQIKNALNSGVPRHNQMIQDYMQAIEKLGSK